MSNDSEHKLTYSVTWYKIFILTKYFDTNYVDFVVLCVTEIDPAVYIKSYIYCTYTVHILYINS